MHLQHKEPSIVATEAKSGAFLEANPCLVSTASTSRSSSYQERQSTASSHSPGSCNAGNTLKDDVESVLSILQEPSVSHSPSNKRYLESKLSGTDGRRKQAYIDQTLASVERAKASLKNLKDFVQQRKLRKKNSIAPNLSEQKLPQEPTVDEDRNYAKIADINESAQRYHSQGNLNILKPPHTLDERMAAYDCGYNSLPAALIKRPGRSLKEANARRDSATSLYASFNEVMNTLQSMMQDTSNTNRHAVDEQSGTSTARIEADAAANACVDTTELPETVIGDMPFASSNYVNVSHAEVQNKYGHLITAEMLDDLAKVLEEAPPPLPPREAPVIPPKPKRFQFENVSSEATSVTNGSSYSAVSSGRSSMDINAVHTYNFEAPKESIYVNRDSLIALPSKVREEGLSLGVRSKRRIDGSPVHPAISPENSKTTILRKQDPACVSEGTGSQFSCKFSQEGSDCSSASSSRTSSRRRGLVRQQATDSDDTPPSISATLQRFAGEAGYLKLQSIRKIAAQAMTESTENMDTTYDNVHVLMESIRNDARNVHWLNQVQSKYELKSSGTSRQISDSPLSARDLIEVLRQEDSHVRGASNDIDSFENKRQNVRATSDPQQFAGMRGRSSLLESELETVMHYIILRLPKLFPCLHYSVGALSVGCSFFRMHFTVMLFAVSSYGSSLLLRGFHLLSESYLVLFKSCSELRRL